MGGYESRQIQFQPCMLMQYMHCVLLCRVSWRVHS
jgi:hypothetical protein